jgi:hypothetical protein
VMPPRCVAGLSHSLSTFVYCSHGMSNRTLNIYLKASEGYLEPLILPDGGF